MADKIDVFEFEFPTEDGTTVVGTVVDKQARDDIEELKKGESGVMVGATASASGSGGSVPAPNAGDQDKFLSGDGTWKAPASGSGVTATPIILANADWTGDAAPYTYDASNAIGEGKTLLSVTFNASRGSTAQETAFKAADIQIGENLTIYSFGDKPSVDLPVICYAF